MLPCPNGIALFVKGCGTGSPISRAGSSSSGSFEVKGLHEHGGTVPVAFYSFPSASNLK